MQLIQAKFKVHNDNDDRCSRGFTLGQEGGLSHPKPEPCPPNLWLQQQYAIVNAANTYTGGVFWRVGVVDLVVLVCFEGDD